VKEIPDAEREEIRTLTSEISAEKNTLADIQVRRAALQKDIEGLKIIRDQNLIPRRDELDKLLKSVQYQEGFTDFESKITEGDKNTLVQSLVDLNDSITQREKRKEELNKSIMEANNRYSYSTKK